MGFRVRPVVNPPFLTLKICGVSRGRTLVQEIAAVAGSGDLPRASLPYWVQCLESAATATAAAATAASDSMSHTDYLMPAKLCHRVCWER